MTMAAGRRTVSYLVRCALASNDSLIKQDQNGNTYTFAGGFGLCPAWKNGRVEGNSTCVESISACLMAHVNTAGIHIPLWLDSENPAIGWGVSPSFPFQEGTFFGNIIDTGPLIDTGKPSVTGPAGYYCEGDGFAGGSTGEVAGRLGSNQVNSPYSNPFGDGVLCKNSAGVVGQWSAGMYDNKGNLKDPDGYKALNTKNATWNNAITVWRNASYTPVFDAGYRYTIQPLSTHANPMVLDGTTGAILQQSMAAKLSTSQFIFTANGANWSISLNNSPTKCLDAGSGATATPITLQTCNLSSTSQQWTITPHANSYGEFTFKNVKGGSYLTTNGSRAGTPISVVTSATCSSQFFDIEAVAIVN
jgi:Ricin-type beta-trefoil lectin domain-like